MGNLDSDQCRTGTRRRVAGAISDAHQYQCFLERWLLGTVWCVGANRRHYAGIHQSTARTWPRKISLPGPQGWQWALPLYEALHGNPAQLSEIAGVDLTRSLLRILLPGALLGSVAGRAYETPVDF